METKQAKKTPKTCEDCGRWKEVKRRIRITELLQQAMEALENRIKSKDLKPTVGDYLKLLQIEQEFSEESPKEIKVTWVEPAESSVEK